MKVGGLAGRLAQRGYGKARKMKFKNAKMTKVPQKNPFPNN